MKPMSGILGEVEAARYLRENGYIVEVPYFNQKLLFQTPRDIVRMIKAGDEQWKEYVPESATRLVEHIKEEA